jgi:hypothetical protein
MKTKNLIFFFGILLLSFGCSNDDLPVCEANVTLLGNKWKLVGYVSGEDGTLKELKPTSDDNYWGIDNYWLFFKNEDTLLVKSSTNDLYGLYEINYSSSTISITLLGGTKINEIFDGKFFIDRLSSVSHLDIEETSLKLYQNEKDYLLFKLVEHESPYRENIIGQWKLTEMDIMYNNDYQNVNVFDYSNNTIIYDFRADNNLTVAGYIPEDISEGEYFYRYEQPNVCPSCLPGPNLYINNNDPVFCLSLTKENKMNIREEKVTGQVIDENGLVIETGEIIRTTKIFVKLN